jgi:hypothetical protein
MTISEEILIETFDAHSRIPAKGTREPSSIDQLVDCTALPAAFEQAGTGRKFLPGKSDAANQGVLVLSGLRAGPLAVIDAGVRTAETIRRYHQDPESIDAFIGVLADGNLLSQRERKLGLASPKLSKLCTIGDHATLLRSDEVLEHFLETGSSGYSVFYQLLIYYKTLQGDGEARFEQLVTLLRARRPSSRKDFSDLTQEAKKAKVRASEIPEQGAAFENGQRFDLILATLEDRRDRRRLGDDYADELPYCRRIHEIVAEQAVAIVIARITDLPVIENKLLAGFAVSQILLLRDPIDPDVTQAQVAVIAVRGRRDDKLITNFRWLPHGEPLDAISLAEQLVPKAKNKLHLFATAETEGWCSIVGETNWSHADE